MKWVRCMVIGSLLCLVAGNSWATTRNFTYSYEPETMPQGELEFEQWVTLRAIRNDAVGQEHYTAWDLREEFEYGLTDYWQLSLYLNEKSEYFRDRATFVKTNEFEFDGVSFENKWMILNPADSPLGLALYLEPTIGNGEFELEEKIILGRRFGADQEWKWALNATHATEWKDTEDPGEGTETEGELEFTTGLIRELNKNWSLGIEFRNHNEIVDDYGHWEHTAFFLGPVVNYRTEKWWVTLTALGQVYGRNYPEEGAVDADGEPDFVLDEHEYLNVRCLFGIEL